VSGTVATGGLRRVKITNPGPPKAVTSAPPLKPVAEGCMRVPPTLMLCTRCVIRLSRRGLASLILIPGRSTISSGTLWEQDMLGTDCSLSGPPCLCLARLGKVG
jgi:hypothetical protein